MPEDPGRREQAQKRALDPESSNFQNMIFSFNEKETSNNPRSREQVPKVYPRPQRPDFQVKDQDSQVENQTPEDGDRIR